MDYKTAGYDTATLAQQLKCAFCEAMRANDVPKMTLAIRCLCDFCYDCKELRHAFNEFMRAGEPIVREYWHKSMTAYIEENW